MKRLGIVLVGVALLGVWPARATDALAPIDYSDTSGLSQPVYTNLTKDTRMLPMSDGVRLYIEVTRPVGAEDLGVIMAISPYHRTGRSGGTIGEPDGLRGYFPPRGYAVVTVDVRGTGNSEGCMDYLGPRDREDFHDVVEWAGTRPWSNGKVGITGVSYPGSTPTLAMASAPEHLATIVPIAGIAQMYDHEFQLGVPYYLQWVGAGGTYDVNYGAYPPMNRRDPAWVANITNGPCGLTNAALSTGADYASGRSVAWHEARDFRADAIAADIPVFLVQGHSDGSVRPIAMEWFTHRDHPGDKLWLGQWGHQATDRARQWVGIVHRWFDKHLLGRDVDTGPPVEVFLHPDDDVIHTATDWPATSSTLTLYPAADGALATTIGPEGSAIYSANAAGGGQVGSNALWSTIDPPTRAVFETAPFEHDVLLSGFPKVHINERIFGGRIDLIASLYGVRDFQAPVLISQAAMNPELRDGADVVVPVTPGEAMTLQPPAWPMNHLVRAGARLRLILSSAHSDKVPIFSGPGVVEVLLGGDDPTRIELGVVDDHILYADPLYPAVVE